MSSDSLEWVWQLAVMSNWGHRVIGFGILWWMLSSVSAQDSIRTEYRYSDGIISSEGYLVEGQPAGYWRSFYPDGIRKSEGNWRKGELEGNWVFFDRKGRLETTLEYETGLKQGEETKWDSLGVLRQTLPWHKDTLDGLQRILDANGVEIQVIPWQKGEKNGVAVDFFAEGREQGRIIRRRGFRDDLLRWVEDINRYDDQNRKTGVWMTFWPNGSVRLEGPFKKGLKEGVFKQFSRQGDLEKTITYHLGKQVKDAPESAVLDVRQVFHSNGGVANVGPWRKDVPMGTHRYFDQNGHLVEVKVYREGSLAATGMLDSLGRRTGPWKEYWKVGEVKAEGRYLEGLKEENWLFYSREGKLDQEGGFRRGQWNGQWKWYYSNGQVHRDERYRKGREEGYFLELSEQGDTLAIGQYERGLQQGMWLEHVNDDVRKGVYLDGERDGVWIHLDSEGKLSFKGEYVSGIPSGEHVEFWPGGARSVVGGYKGGLKQGNWRYFDELGLLQLVRQYKAGRIVKVNGSKTDQ